VAIDDFGTGYSSLSYLRQFPINVLKIDQSFVQGIGADPVGTSIVCAVISMGKSLGYRVIAEGVENGEQLAFLRAQRCHEGQGNYFSPPLVAGQFVGLQETVGATSTMSSRATSGVVNAAYSLSAATECEQFPGEPQRHRGGE
jgi:EAL domain-containing protein (putative c-di-GMP-specific phosphodiesterase class I)